MMDATRRPSSRLGLEALLAGELLVSSKSLKDASAFLQVQSKNTIES